MYMGSGILELHQLKVFSGFKRSYRTSRVNNMGAELKIFYNMQKIIRN